MPLPDTMMADADAQRRLFAGLTPSSVYLTIDDNLRVTAYNSLASVVCQIRLRMLNLEGRVVPSGSESLTPTTNRAATSTLIVTDEGWLLGGQVFVSGAAPLEGQTFVVVELVRGAVAANAVPVQVIASGYVTAKMPLTFPGPVKSALDGQGVLRSIVGTVPGAGAEITETVPTGARWELKSLSLALITAVAVANRIPAITLDDGASLFFASAIPGNETASATWSNQWGQGIGFSFSAAAFVGNAAIPVGVRLPAGGRIRTSTTNIQAADQYGAPRYEVLEWLEGA